MEHLDLSSRETQSGTTTSEIGPHEPAIPLVGTQEQCKPIFTQKPVCKGPQLLYSQSPKSEKNQNTLHLGMEEQTIIHSHNGMLFSKKKNRYWHMKQPWRTANALTVLSGYVLWDSIYIGKGKTTEQKNPRLPGLALGEGLTSLWQ